MILVDSAGARVAERNPRASGDDPTIANIDMMIVEGKPRASGDDPRPLPDLLVRGP